MLELTDSGVVGYISTLFGISTNDIIYSPESFALELRTRKVAKQSQQSISNTVLPFVSYYRTGSEYYMTRANTYLAETGIPVQEDPVTHKIEMYKFVPARLTYDIRYWTKDGRDINTFTRNYFRYKLFKNLITIVFKAGYNVDLGVEFEDIAYENRKQPEEWKESGPIFNTNFNLNVNSWICTNSASPVLIGLIEKVIVKIIDGKKNGDQILLSEIQKLV